MSKTAVISEQGLRWRMEDAYILRHALVHAADIFAGVYDGHCGDYAAAYASQTLHLHFAHHLQQGQKIEQAFINSYQKVSQELSRVQSGTTAAHFYLLGRELSVANAGDSRIIIVSKEGVRQLSRDHRLDDPQEMDRILSYGAEISYPYVLRQGMGLMPTRSLGDSFFESVGVISTPDVHQERIQDRDLWLIAGCDGLFDVLDNQEVAGIARSYSDVRELAEGLSQEVLIQRMGTDNLTIIVLALQPGPGMAKMTKLKNWRFEL
ncbi:MAG: PP2C family serine/threonine-protein phosphatase [Desulfohalobiaceae bacterium]